MSLSKICTKKRLQMESIGVQTLKKKSRITSSCKKTQTSMTKISKSVHSSTFAGYTCGVALYGNKKQKRSSFEPINYCKWLANWRLEAAVCPTPTSFCWLCKLATATECSKWRSVSTTQCGLARSIRPTPFSLATSTIKRKTWDWLATKTHIGTMLQCKSVNTTKSGKPKSTWTRLRVESTCCSGRKSSYWTTIQSCAVR